MPASDRDGSYEQIVKKDTDAQRRLGRYWSLLGCTSRGVGRGRWSTRKHKCERRIVRQAFELQGKKVKKLKGEPYGHRSLL